MKRKRKKYIKKLNNNLKIQLKSKIFAFFLIFNNPKKNLKSDAYGYQRWRMNE